jgi:hypothetical protein
MLYNVAMLEDAPGAEDILEVTVGTVMVVVEKDEKEAMGTEVEEKETVVAVTETVEEAMAAVVMETGVVVKAMEEEEMETEVGEMVMEEEGKETVGEGMETGEEMEVMVKKEEVDSLHMFVQRNFLN